MKETEPELNIDFSAPKDKETLLDAAQRFLEAGISVIPAKKSKQPPLKRWKPYQENPASPEQLAKWFPRHQCIAIICGKVSGNIELIDFDFDEKRPDIFNEWRKLVEDEDPDLFKKLVIQTTQNNGFHCLYRCPELQIPGNQTLAQYSSGESLKTLIETRGEGGYFLADPSLGYKLTQGKFTRIPQIIPSEREILLRSARLLNEHTPPTRSPKTRSNDQGRPGLSPGDDFNERGDIRAFLESKGWTFTGVSQGDAERWRRPDKDRGSSASLLDGKKFYNFSSNAHPLESNQSYDLFGLYTFYEHGGDFKAAARALAQEGYGDSLPQQPETRTKKLEFPSWVMAGVAGDFATLYSSYLEVPPHFLYIAFLTCLGVAVADRLTLASEIAPQPRLYVILLGESADDRKSTAIAKTIDFFREAIDRFPSTWGVNSAAGLQRYLQKDNRLILCFDEFKQFVSKCKRENSSLLPCVGTLFELNRFETRTKTEHVKLENAYLSIIAASTVETYENTWEPAFTDIGFNNRLFLVPGAGERKYSLPAKIPDKDKYLLRKQTGEILGHVGADGLELDLTPEAIELYDNWYMNREKTVYSKRLDTYSYRFLSLMAVNELKREVDHDIVSKVIALMDWQYKARSLHDPIDAQGTVAALEARIRRALLGKGPRTNTELKRDVNYSRYGIWAWETAINNMKRAKEIKWDRKAKEWYAI